nr:MAG TPA: hypothetical protein [Caudoviricetes sp.]
MNFIIMNHFNAIKNYILVHIHCLASSLKY